MKILWVTVDRSNRVARIFEPLQEEVSKLTDVTFISKRINLLASKYQRVKVIEDNIVDVKFANEFDFVMVDAPFAFTNERWDKIDVPKGLLIEDQHGPNPEFSKKYFDDGFGVFFTRYKTGILDKHPHLVKSKIRWLPHSIDPLIFKDYKLEKKIDSLMIGSKGSRVYKLRNKIHNKLNGQPYYLNVDRPPETVKYVKKKWPVGNDYAKLINSSKITFTCSSVLNYVVLKFFEIPSCRSALFSDYIPEMGELGFKPNENMVEVKGNIRNLVQKWLASSELKHISDNGYNMVHSNHTAKVRAKQFMRIINDL